MRPFADAGRTYSNDDNRAPLGMGGNNLRRAYDSRLYTLEILLNV